MTNVPLSEQADAIVRQFPPEIATYYEPFFSWLAKQRGSYALSLNGFVGDEDQTVNVPRDLYHQHFQIYNGMSATLRINRLGIVPVTDSLYIKNNGDSPVAGLADTLRLCGS